MRKNLFILSIVTVLATTVITSCGNEDCKLSCPSTAAEREALYVGTYTGTVNLQVEISGQKVAVPVTTTFNVTNPVAGDDSVSLTSPTLDNGAITIKAKIDASDCSKITTQTISQDTLRLENMPNTLAGIISGYKPLRIVNFQASGTGTMNCDAKTLNVNINVASGTTKSPNAVLNNLDVSGTTLSVQVKK